MDGLECMRRIRQMERDGKLPSHIPIIALTANAAGTFLNK
jgi:CheY-like chemotaxis protein